MSNEKLLSELSFNEMKQTKQTNSYSGISNKTLKEADYLLPEVVVKRFNLDDKFNEFYYTKVKIGQNFWLSHTIKDIKLHFL